MEVLVCLARHPGETLPKEQLLQTVWLETFVSDDVLIRSISEIRRAFEDDARESKFIQTIPKRGYRLVAPVVIVNGNTGLATEISRVADEMKGSSFARRGLRVGIVIGVISSVALLVLLALMPADVWRKLTRKSEVPQIRSIAVLPLQNLSRDPEQEYFAEEMTEELITELSRISALQVISRTSVKRYKESDKSLPEIAHELNVDAIIVGSAFRSGDRVRITAQLIYAPKDTNLWAETYDRDLRDVLTLQSEIARSIAAEVNIQTTQQERARLETHQTVNTKALEAYLLGQYHLNRVGRGYGKDEGQAALSYFQRAVAEDPTFAEAYLKMADATFFLPPNQAMSLQRAAVEKALELDPNLAEAHVTLGTLKFSEWDLAGAEREFKRALELNPSSAAAHDWLAMYLASTGRRDESKAEAELRQRLDPLHYSLSLDVIPGDEDRGIARLRTFLEFNPEDGFAHLGLAGLYARKGLQKEYVGELQRAAILFGFPKLANDIDVAYTSSGYPGALRALAIGLDRYGANQPLMVAEAYARLGDKDLAFRWLDKACREHDGGMMLLNLDEEWNSLRSDPRFAKVVRRVGLPQ